MSGQPAQMRWQFSNYDKELAAKRDNQAGRILRLLQKAGSKGVLNTELNPISFRYSAHIFNLRKKGWNIKTEPVDKLKGLYKFTLNP